MLHEILFATNNPGKLSEVGSFAQQYGVTVYSPRNLNLDIPVEETGSTFRENAALKYSAHMNAMDDPDMMVIADDSGIAIDALGGEPGLYSRRWNGYEMSDEEIIDYCLERMADVPTEQRTAHFISVIAYGYKDEKPQFVSGKITGKILQQPVEAGRIEGFPFRTLFYLPDIGKMLYEVHDAPLNQRPEHLTHREQALQKIFEVL